MKILAGIGCITCVLALSTGAGAAQFGAPGQTGLFPNPAPQPFVPAFPPAVVPSASRAAAPFANPIGTVLNPPGLLPVASLGAGPSSPGAPGGGNGTPAGFDHLLYVQSPPVVPGMSEGDAAGNWRLLPTCK